MLRARADASRPWPLTGRRGELEVAAAALSSEDVDAVLLTGSPGVGKSRLMRELVGRLGDTATAAWVTGSSSTATVPLGALAHALPRQTSTDPVDLLAEVRAALGGGSAPSPARRLVLALDDAHLLDPTTVTLLAQLVWAGGTRLVATLPDRSVAPEPLQLLWRAGRATVIELAPLDDLAVDTLVHRALGGPVDGAAMLALLDASAGNPLFLRELVLGSLTAGKLSEIAGVWRMTGAPEPSGMLRALVQHRVSSLGADVHTLLEDVAIGAPVGLDDLTRRHGDVVLERAERAGLLRVADSGLRRTVTLAHGLHADVLRDSLGRLATGRLARTHAEAVERHGSRRRADHWRVALWRLTADGSAPVDVLVRAALLARAARDLNSVERLARAALAQGPDVAVSRALAESLFERGRFSDALQVVEAAKVATPGSRTDARLAATEALILGFGLRRLDEAVALLAKARASAVAGADRSRLTDRLAFMQASQSGPAAALATLSDDVPDPTDHAIRKSRRTVSMLVLALAGRTGEALAEGADDPVTVTPDIRNAVRMLVLTEAGRLREAEELAGACHTAAARAGLRWPQLWFAGGLGRLALLHGRPKRAARWFREQASLAEELHQHLAAQFALGGLMTAAGWTDAGDVLDESWTAWQRLDTDDDHLGLLPAHVARGLAWHAIRVGRLEAAHELLNRVQRRCEGAGHVGQAAEAAYERVRLLRPGGVADDLARYARTTDSPLVKAYAAHAAAAAAGDVAGLSAAAERLSALGLALAAAEASAAAAGAAALGNEGRRAQALSLLAARRRSGTEGASTPALLVAPAGPGESLTPREREIAFLVAQGRSSKEIAEALVLSVRTVDNHLQRVFTKLGVSSRADVKAALEEDP